MGKKSIPFSLQNRKVARATDRDETPINRAYIFQWKNLYGRKPSENYEDPDMLAAIEDAKNNMGDFNLKTATNYKVPESQRQGASFKRAQLLELRRMVGYFVDYKYI